YVRSASPSRMATPSGKTSAERSRNRTGDRSAYPPPPRSAAMTSGALTSALGGRPTRRSPRTKRVLCHVLCALVDHQRDGESVVALRADRLDRGGEEVRAVADELDEAPGPANRRAGRVRVGHGAAAHDVVADDDRARPREPDRPLEVLGIAGLVGVDEDE